MAQRVEARAPTRIDFAGGTVDLWPLYLLHERPLTVNAAITLYASAVIETAEGTGIEVISRDRGTSCRLRAEDHGQDVGAELEFIVRLVRHFLGSRAAGVGEVGARVVTDCRAPAGSGLGGSSTLGIALAAALDRHAGRGLDRERLLYVTRAIETQVLGIPSGEQDYHPALHGGALALHYTVEGTKVERLPVDLRELRRRTVLVDTGVSRNSGVSNWDIFKRHLDGDRGVRSSLQAISDAAHQVREAILAGDWDGAGTAVGREWQERRRLSPAVSDARIERLISEGVAAGAVAGKVCGAGGGGCLVLWVRDGAADPVSESVTRAGGAVLDFDYTERGVEVTVS
jgi:D-glycero-alpha-D-manno-heptose-7-phosphate kinase